MAETTKETSCKTEKQITFSKREIFQIPEVLSKRFIHEFHSKEFVSISVFDSYLDQSSWITFTSSDGKLFTQISS